MVEAGHRLLCLDSKAVQGFFLTLQCSESIFRLRNMSGRWLRAWHKPDPRGLWWLQERLPGRHHGPMNSESPSRKDALPDWTSLASTSSLLPLPQECSYEGAACEFWKGTVNGCSCTLLCKWYTNWSLKSGPNDAILLCLPAFLTPILRCTVQMLVYYVHQ